MLSSDFIPQYCCENVVSDFFFSVAMSHFVRPELCICLRSEELQDENVDIGGLADFLYSLMMGVHVTCFSSFVQLSCTLCAGHLISCNVYHVQTFPRWSSTAFESASGTMYILSLAACSWYTDSAE
jgi:hypothetical protein